MDKQMYIDLLKKVLIDYHRVGTAYKPLHENLPTWKFHVLSWLDGLLRKRGYAVCKSVIFQQALREEGKDWPTHADTMVGMKRLSNVEYCVKQVIEEGVPGDFIETGVWRGGTTIFMKALLNIFDENHRNVWVADSFEGLPRPDKGNDNPDRDDTHYLIQELAIGLETVKENFRKYNLLDDNVKFLKGWFKDTLPTAPIKQLAVLRLDGDMYESTMDGLVNLYPKLSVGGYLIVDDWGAVPRCQEAVLDYRKEHGIKEEIIPIDWTGVYWKKEKAI